MKYRFNFLDVNGRIHRVVGDIPIDTTVGVSNALTKNKFATFPMDDNVAIFNLDNMVSVEIFKEEEEK